MQPIIYEYSVFQYMPDAERAEALNIGIIMMCKKQKWLRIQFCVNKERLQIAFPSADLELLCQQIKAFKTEGVPDVDMPVEERYRWMTAAKSAIIRALPSHPGIMPPISEEDNTDNQLNVIFKHLRDTFL